MQVLQHMEIKMENNIERVLAYTLAKTISNEELASISGGSGTQMTIITTFHATGSPGQVPSMDFDVRTD